MLELGNKERSTKAGHLKVKELRGTTRVLKSHIVLTCRSFMVEKSRYLRKGWGKKYDKNDLAEHTSFEDGNGTLTTNVLFYCLRNIKVLLPGSISAALSLGMPSVSGFQQCMSPIVSRNLQPGLEYS